MSSIILLTLRALGRGRRLLVIALLLAVPTLLALAYRLSPTHSDGGRFTVGLFAGLMLPILLPLTVLIFATSALGAEIEDRTLVYLTLRPVARLTIIVAKALAAAGLAGAFVEVALAATYLIATPTAPDLQDLGAILLAGLCGCLAYTGLFLLLGALVPRRALVIGFIYVLLWEGTAAGLSSALSTLSLRRYIEGVLHGALGRSPLAALQGASIDGGPALLVLALVVAISLALTTWTLQRIELP